MGEVIIGYSSPLLRYSGGWFDTPQGAQASGSGDFAVELDSQNFSSILLSWESNGYEVNAGLDGQLQPGTSTNGATLNAQFGTHSARLEVACSSCDGAQFLFNEVQLTTELGTNSSLDDASSAITYQGFDSAQKSIPGVNNGDFYQGTISYTSSAGATASFGFQGSALYIFGPTGQSFGGYSVSIDGANVGNFNASSSINVYDTLLFFASGLQDASHEVVLTNEVNNLLFALDFVVASSGSSTGQPGSGQPPTSTVFPQPGNHRASPGLGSAGAAIGGTIAAVVILFLLWIWYRYYKYRKAGGEGDCFEMFFGARHRKKPDPPKEPPKFKIWPMLSFKPKYAT